MRQRPDGNIVCQHILWEGRKFKIIMFIVVFFVNSEFKYIAVNDFVL